MSQLPKINKDLGFLDSTNPLKTISTMAHSTAAKRESGLQASDLASMNRTMMMHRSPRDASQRTGFAPSARVRGPMATNTTLIQQRLNNLGDILGSTFNGKLKINSALDSHHSGMNNTQKPGVGFISTEPSSMRKT